jgi:hypothetical protein
MKTEKDMLPCKFKVGDTVVYAGLQATVESISPVYSYNYWLLSLVSVEDEELTCTANECECEPFNSDIFDTDLSEQMLADARLESCRIQNLGDSLTDKYFRDGNH